MRLDRIVIALGLMASQIVYLSAWAAPRENVSQTLADTTEDVQAQTNYIIPPRIQAVPDTSNVQKPDLSNAAAIANEQNKQASPQVVDVVMQKEVESLAPQGWASNNPTVVLMPAGPETLYRLPLEDPQVLSMLNEFHCSSIITKTFQRGHRQAVLQVYCFADPVGAYAAYAAVRRGASTVVARGDGSSEDDQSISFWQNNYFIRLLTTAEDDEEAKELLRTLADSLAKNISGHASAPLSITALPGWGKVVGSEKIVMGPVSGRRLLSLPYAGQLSLDRSQYAIVVDYQFAQPNPERMRLLVVDYGNHNLAVNTFHRYIQPIQEAHKYEYAGSSCLVRMSDGYMLCFYRGTNLIIITGARKKMSTYMLAKQLDYYVRDVVR